MNGQSLRDLIKADGPREATRKLVFLLRSDDHKEVTPEKFSLREAWEAYGRPTLKRFAALADFRDESELREEAFTASMFAILTGELIARTVILAYDAPAAIGDQLVTVMPSKRRFERIPGVGAMEMPIEVHEAEEYPELGGLEEKYVTSRALKKGIIIAVTEELVTEDQLGLVLDRARQVGERIRQEREQTIINGVIDAAGAVYAPLGVPQPLYQVPNNNIVFGNALVDWRNFDAADNQLGTMQDEIGQPILVDAKISLVPRALKHTNNRIVNTTEVRDVAQVQLVRRNAWAAITPLSSPYMDLQSEVEWYFGDFKRQFVWHEVWPLQVLRAKPGNEDEFERDIFARFKARYLGGIAARDHRYVVKNLASAAS